MYLIDLVRSVIYAGKIKARGEGNDELFIMYMNSGEDIDRGRHSISVWVHYSIVQSLYSQNEETISCHRVHIFIFRSERNRPGHIGSINPKLKEKAIHNLDESDVRLEAGLEKKRKRKNVKMIGNK